MENDAYSQMAAALNGHQITDDQGSAEGEMETPVENTAAQDQQPPVEETARVEQPAKSAPEAPKAPEVEDEIDLVETAADETGNKYVPEKRFKEVYAKQKAYERELKAAQAQLATQQAVPLPAAPIAATPKSGKASQSPESPVSKADILELRMTLPQFDPRYDENGVATNPEYNRDLDVMAFQVFEANKSKGMSVLDAAKQAIRFAKSISSKELETRTEARTVKALQSDQGITTRVVSRGATSVDPDKMNESELMEYMKANGMW